MARQPTFHNTRFFLHFLMEYQVFLCLGLKEMEKFLWEGREKVAKLN